MEVKKDPTWRIILRFGLLGGVVALYFSAIGMVEAFSLRNLVGTIISLGHVLLVVGAVGAGYLTARQFKDKPAKVAVAASFLAGLISSIFLILLILFIQVTIIRTAGQPTAFNWRGMFVNFSPGLVDFLTFGQGIYLGSLILALFSGLMGVLGSSFFLLPPLSREALLSGIIWTLGIGLFSENISQIFQQILGRGVVKLFFQEKSLHLIVAGVIFILMVIETIARRRIFEKLNWSNLAERSSGLRLFIGFILLLVTLVFLMLTLIMALIPARWFLIYWQRTPLTDTERKILRGAVLGSGVMSLIALPWIVGLFLSQALFMIGLYVMMGLGLNIVVGYAGLLDLGYVAFFAFGAYVMGVTTTLTDLNIGGFNFWMALPICVLAGVLWGLLLGFPVLRMRGDYLAIVTLGFGEIIRILALSDWLAPIEGGAQGILKIPNPIFFGIRMGSPQTLYYVVILGILLAAFVTIRLRDSRLGRQWMAMREDEDVAEAMGINLVQTKLLAFAIGAAFSALAGGIFAARLSTIFPHTFNLLWSINALALIIVGGLGSIPGVIVGSLILVGLPELLREFTEYRLLMYGFLLIVMMLVRPEGFIPEPTRQRELRMGEADRIEATMESLGESGD